MKLIETNFQKALNRTTIPKGVTFYSDGRGKGTASIDRHRKDVVEVMVMVTEFGRKHFKDFVKPTVTDGGGRPAWAVLAYNRGNDGPWDATERHVWIGACDDEGHCRGKRTAYFRDSKRHGDTPTHGGVGIWDTHRWRHVEGSNVVFWYELPDERIRDAVEAWLWRKGCKVNLRHKVMGDCSREEDFAHGHHAVSEMPREYRESVNRLSSSCEAAARKVG